MIDFVQEHINSAPEDQHTGDKLCVTFYITNSSKQQQQKRIGVDS
jgi:hypothetical protein